MFGNAYGSTSLGDLQKSYYQQLETLSKMQQQQQMQKLSVLDEINRSVSSLSNEEQSVLAQSHDYQLAKQTYEAGFNKGRILINSFDELTTGTTSIPSHTIKCAIYASDVFA